MKSKKLLLIFFILIFVASCSHKNVKKENQNPEIKKPAKVYIPPFKYYRENGYSNWDIKVKKENISYSYDQESMILIARDLADKFYLKLKNMRKDYKPYSYEDVENVFETNAENVPLKKIKRRFNVKYIIQGYILKFVEREGNSFSVKRPAEVDFVIVMKDIDSGEIVWQAEYHEKQEPLSSNLLYFYKFLKRKGKWLSALELTENVFNKLVMSLP